MSLWLLADAIVILIVFIFGYTSMKRGFLKSSYNGVARFAAIILVLCFHTSFEGYLQHSFVGDTLRDKIYSGVEKTVEENAAADAEEIIEEMNLPGFIKGMMATKVQDGEYENIKENITQSISDMLFPFAMQIISVIILYILIRVGLWLAFCALKLVFEMPILGGMNKLLGAVIGGINSLLCIYIISAIIMIFAPSEFLKTFEAGVDTTFIYQFFYYNNIITNLFLG